MKRTPIRSRSTRTAARDRRYSIERRAFLEQHPICEAVLDGCQWSATEVHHKAGRLPAVFFRRDLWMALCSRCHRWITEHPAEAYARGWSLRRHELEGGAA